MEGVRKRCFTYTFPGAGIQTKFTFCIDWPQWPPIVLSAYPTHPGPDPGPVLQIEGIDSKVLQELATLDFIHALSEKLSPALKESVREAVGRSVAQIQRQLPTGLSISEG